MIVYFDEQGTTVEEEFPKEQLRTGATTAGPLVNSICVNFGRFPHGAF
jgi:hypothetical protein